MFDEIKIQTFKPSEVLPNKVILPQQTHGAKVVKIQTGLENLESCDGMWSESENFLLGVKTADCAPICLWNDTQFGILHAGWRGTVNGAIENMLQAFEFELGSNSPSRPSRDGVQNYPGMAIWVGPLLPRFEIQKDRCFQQIHTKFGDRFFTKNNGKIMFEFKHCLQFLLPNAQFDTRSTSEDSTLASWRRDKRFPKGQNVTVIGPSQFF